MFTLLCVRACVCLAYLHSKVFNRAEMDTHLATPTPRTQHRRSRSSVLFSSAGDTSSESTPRRTVSTRAPLPPLENLRNARVTDLEPYFGDLAPLAFHHTDRKHEESISLAVKAATSARPLSPLSTQERQNISTSLTAIYVFARNYIDRVPQLRETEAYKAYARDARAILEDWETKTDNFLAAIAKHPRTQGDTLMYEGEIKEIRLPTDAEWAHVNAVLVEVYLHASQNVTGHAQRALCKSLLDNYCTNPCLAKWLAFTDGLGAFRYHLQCNQGHALDAQWSTGTWSDLGHAWHPELAEHTFLVLKDMAVPIPWRGLGFSRVLRSLERRLVVDYATLRIDGLFLHHVHRDMLAITLGRGMHGYRFWAHPFPEDAPAGHFNADDSNFRAELTRRANAAIAEGAPRSTKPWMFAVTETYGNSPEYAEVFHLYWLTPMGMRLAAMHTRAKRNVLVPLAALRQPLRVFCQAACHYMRAIEEDHTTFEWWPIPLGNHAAANDETLNVRMRVSNELCFPNNDNWTLHVDISPCLDPVTESLCKSATYFTQVALISECITCLCDTFVYTTARIANHVTPPAIIQLSIGLSDECDDKSDDTETLASDMRDLLGKKLVAATEHYDPRRTVFTIFNNVKRY